MPEQTDLPSAIAQGRCLCASIVFDVTLPSQWAAHCHCSRCQRAHGAAFVTWVGMLEERVRISDPQQRLRWFHNPDGGDRGFCGHCGSPMFFRSEQWPGELHIARALFIDPIDRDPQRHVYHDTHVDWVRVNDGLPSKADPDA